MEKLADLDKKQKMINDIKACNRQLHAIAQTIMEWDMEDKIAQQAQLEQGADIMARLINEFAEMKQLNSVTLKLFVSSIQFVFKELIEALKTPMIVRVEDLH